MVLFWSSHKGNSLEMTSLNSKNMHILYGDQSVWLLVQSQYVGYMELNGAAVNYAITF